MVQTLWIDVNTGISGDRFAAALIGLGVPERGLLQAIQSAGEELGMLDAHTHIEFLPDETLAHRLHLTPLGKQDPLPLEEAPAHLDQALANAGVEGIYAGFAHRTLSILRAAEAHINDDALLAPDQTVPLAVIGTAHTPYQHKAPYQPQPGNSEDGAFYIQVAPQYAAATQALGTFSHIFVLSYLNRALEPEITVRPPWKDGAERYGAFATRSPNRPSPIGLTRTRLLRIEGNRIITGPLDLFDGTPILDIKPFIQTLDGLADEEDAGNDGWLEGSDHLELHRLGIPHAHPGGSGSLAQPQILIALLTGIAWGLQHLGADITAVICTSPLNTGPGHALELTVQSILEQHKIPHQPGAIPGELITPDGAAILAALSPEFVDADKILPPSKRAGLGLGGQTLAAAPALGALRLCLVDTRAQERSSMSVKHTHGKEPTTP